MAKSEVSSSLKLRLLLGRKRKQIEIEGQGRWQTEEEKQIYSSKLVTALRLIRRSESDAAIRSRVVRNAADRVLAVFAGGKTRWSRAILRRRGAGVNKKHKKAARTSAAGSIRRMPAAPMKPPSSPLQRKINALSRLVPGCRKISLPGLLAETTDYIAALEMQVKAMKFLTAVLDGGA